MNPTVVAAAIGVGGTVIVGVAGFGASIWNTRRTIANDHEKRVWDRRADTYLAMLAAVRSRQIEKGSLPDSVDPTISDAYYHAGPSEAPDWFRLEAAMRAFASPQVLWAMENSSRANARVPSRRGPGDPPEPADHPDPPVPMELLAEARSADDALVVQIRRELQGRSQAQEQPPGPPGLVRSILLRAGVRR